MDLKIIYTKYKKLFKGFILLEKFFVSYLNALFVSNNEKRIIIVAQNSHVGGTHTFLVNLLSNLVSQEKIITLVVPEIDSKDPQWLIFNNFPINVITYKNTDLPHLEYWYGPKHILRYYFAKDIIHQLIYFLRLKIQTRSGLLIVSSAYPCSFLSCLLLPHKVLYFIHSMPWGEIDGGNKKILAYAMSLKRNILTVSEYAKKRVLDKWSICETYFVKVLYNSVALTELTRQYEICDSYPDYHVVTCGNVLGVKNPMLWIEIAKKVQQEFPHRKVIFTWCGNGPQYNECIAKTLKYPDIRFLGHVDNVFVVLQSATIYFQPSLWESHGLAVVEAMSLGIPCIVTKEGGTSESVIDGYNGYTVDVSDKNSVVEKLISLLRDSEMRNLMSKRAIERYSLLFSVGIWQKNFNQLIRES
jgi:glycosyltransferase involved in cell wall biosynthesis